jgi:hypothetical protein
MTTNKNTDNGVHKGSKVRFRPESTMPHDYDIPRNEVGTIVEVADPPPVGPTYMVRAEFASCDRKLPFVYWPEFVPA